MCVYMVFGVIIFKFIIPNNKNKFEKSAVKGQNNN